LAASLRFRVHLSNLQQLPAQIWGEGGG